MPLAGREIGPVRICQARFVLPNNGSNSSTHNLEETTYIALVGIMKQLGDIAEFADEIFGSVYDIARQTVRRTATLSTRLTMVNEKLKNRNLDCNIQRRSPDPIREQALLNKHTRPPAVRDKFALSAPAPPLHQFNNYSPEGVKANLLYSDPSLFVNSWIKLMNKEAEELKKPRKRSFKKPRSHEKIPNKMATLKKKVHDPKNKGAYQVIDIEPQYATLPLKDSTRSSIRTQVQHSKSVSLSSSNGYNSVSSNISRTRSTVCPSQMKLFRQSSFHSDTESFTSPTCSIVSPVGSPTRSLSSPSPPSNGPDSLYEECAETPSELRDLSPTFALSTLTPLEEQPLPLDLPPPPDDFIIGDFDNLPLPTPPPSPPPASPLPPASPNPPASPVFASSPTITAHEPPPFSPPPVPDDVVKPEALTLAQRVLRTQSVPDYIGRDTLLEAIRTASVALKPSGLRKIPDKNEPIYALTGGTDVASILQRRKFLIGSRGPADSDGSTSDDSQEDSWD